MRLSTQHQRRATAFAGLCKVAGIALYLFAAQAHAALPATQAPTRGEGSNWLDTLKNYGYDAAMLLGLAMCAIALLGVARHGFGVYHEIHVGKKTWHDLGVTVVVGVVMAIMCIFFVTKATGVM